MLVLTRKREEVIVIRVAPCERWTEIRVKVVDARDGKVRLGTQAPPHVRIDREEVDQIAGPPVLSVDGRAC